MLGTISAFAYRHRETKKNLCRDGKNLWAVVMNRLYWLLLCTVCVVLALQRMYIVSCSAQFLWVVLVRRFIVCFSAHIVLSVLGHSSYWLF